MQIVEQYINYLVLNKNNYINTNKSSKSDIIQHFLYMKNINISIYDMNTNIFLEYLEHLKKRYKLNSVIKKISALKGFYLFLYNKNLTKNIVDFKYIETLNKNDNYKSFNNFEYFHNLDKIFDNKELKDNFYDERIKIILELLINYKIDIILLNYVETDKLIEYQFKKIVIKRENKIHNYNLNEDTQIRIKNFYNKYEIKNKIFFLEEKEKNIYNILNKKNIKINEIKNNFNLDEENIKELIRKKYFEIGIGDK